MRSLAWQDVVDVRLKVKSGEGVTFVFPAIVDSKGKLRLIGALGEFAGKNRSWAEDVVVRLLATRDQQLGESGNRGTGSPQGAS